MSCFYWCGQINLSSFIKQSLLNPFTNTTSLRQKVFENSWPNAKKIKINIYMRILLLDKHCSKRRNCSWWGISPFGSMFSKVVCCRFGKMHLKWERFECLWTSGNNPFSDKPLVNTFPHIDAFWRLCSRRLFGNISDKRTNCLKRAVSPFATVFSTFSHRLSIQL